MNVSQDRNPNSIGSSFVKQLETISQGARTLTSETFSKVATRVQTAAASVLSIVQGKPNKDSHIIGAHRPSSNSETLGPDPQTVQNMQNSVKRKAAVSPKPAEPLTKDQLAHHLEGVLRGPLNNNQSKLPSYYKMSGVHPQKMCKEMADHLAESWVNYRDSPINSHLSPDQKIEGFKEEYKSQIPKFLRAVFDSPEDSPAIWNLLKDGVAPKSSLLDLVNPLSDKFLKV